MAEWKPVQLTREGEPRGYYDGDATWDAIVARGDGPGFARGNLRKYTDRMRALLDGHGKPTDTLVGLAGKMTYYAEKLAELGVGEGASGTIP